MTDPRPPAHTLRSRLRPVRLAARQARERGLDRGQAIRERAYLASRRSTTAPWMITSGTAASSWFRKGPNFGDELGPLLLRGISGVRPLWVRPDYEGKIVAVGSILAYVRRSDLVVGAGLIRPNRIELPSSARVLGVRGPLTAHFAGLKEDRMTFGDPGLLAAEVLGIFKPLTPAREVAVVPHQVDRVVCERMLAPYRGEIDFAMVDVRSGPTTVIRAISEARVCISSSLHGLIVAESLGIPAVWMSLSDNLTGGRFKFDDYYLGTDRSTVTPLSFEDAMEAALSGEVPSAKIPTTGVRRMLVEVGRLSA